MSSRGRNYLSGIGIVISIMVGVAWVSMPAAYANTCLTCEGGDTPTPDTGEDPSPIPTCSDFDNDGYTAEDAGDCTLDQGDEWGDCNDTAASVYPGATEIANDGIDQDCDGTDGGGSQPTDVSAGICKTYFSVQTDDGKTSITSNVPSDVTYGYPNWSSDGTKLIFHAYKSGTESAICLYNKTSSTMSTLMSITGSAAGAVSYHSPLFFPEDASTFAVIDFNTNRGTAASLVYVYSIGTDNKVTYLYGLGSGRAISKPRFSAQGTYLVYLEDSKIVRVLMSDKSEMTISPASGQTFSDPMVDESGNVYSVDSTAKSILKFTNATTSTALVSSGADHLVGLSSDQNTLFYDYGSSNYVKSGATSFIVGSSTIYKVPTVGGEATVVAKPSAATQYATSNYGGTIIHNNGADYLVYVDCDLDNTDDEGKAICDDSNAESKWRLKLFNIARGTTDTMWSTDQYIDSLLFSAAGALVSLKHSYDVAYYTITDSDGDTHTIGSDCDDADAVTYPGATEVEDWFDNDCDGSSDEGTTLYDDDGDGYCEGFLDVCEMTTWLTNDCDDTNANIHPNAHDATDNIDNDCDGKVDEDFGAADDDGDGQSETQGDCNDADAAIYCGASDTPANGTDNDCDGLTDDANNGDAATDDDGDGYSEAQGDCSDLDKTMYPGADEWKDHVDNNCNCQIDEDDEDSDGDGYTVGTGDCNNNDASIHPEATDIYGDGIDSNCDGDDETPADEDGDGISDVTDNCPSVSNYYQTNLDNDLSGDACDNDADGDGYISIANGGADCDDANAAIHPNMTEVDDDIDNDCDGTIDEGFSPAPPSDENLSSVDDDGDNFTEDAGDCDDDNAAVHPDATEIGANGIDDNCDDVIDDDLDGDGYCSAQGSHCIGTGDCNDGNDAIHPGANDLGGRNKNGIDDNCNGRIDEEHTPRYRTLTTGGGINKCSLNPDAKAPIAPLSNAVWIAGLAGVGLALTRRRLSR